MNVYKKLINIAKKNAKKNHTDVRAEIDLIYRDEKLVDDDGRNLLLDSDIEESKNNINSDELCRKIDLLLGGD